MTTEFTFDETKSFDQNFAVFLDLLDDVDEQMAAILRANAPALAAIVRDGDRHGDARAAFNATVAATLDTLAASEPEPEDL